jgi:hypothetical protein
MNKVTRSVLSLMALLMITVGASFAQGNGVCCDGGPCCHQAGCCHGQQK